MGSTEKYGTAGKEESSEWTVQESREQLEKKKSSEWTVQESMGQLEKKKVVNGQYRKVGNSWKRRK